MAAQRAASATQAGCSCSCADRVRAAWLALHLLLVLALVPAPVHGRALRKVHATVAYRVEGKQTVVGPDGRPGSWGLGGQVVSQLALRDASTGAQLGWMAAHCHIVAKAGGADSWRAVCTKHLDWADGSTMTAHSTETVGSGNQPVSSRMVIAGGIGRWEGAHGEDVAFTYNPASGQGSGKIELTCLKGVC